VPLRGELLAARIAIFGRDEEIERDGREAAKGYKIEARGQAGPVRGPQRPVVDKVAVQLQAQQVPQKARGAGE